MHRDRAVWSYASSACADNGVSLRHEGPPILIQIAVGFSPRLSRYSRDQAADTAGCRERGRVIARPTLPSRSQNAFQARTHGLLKTRSVHKASYGHNPNRAAA